MRRGTSCDTYSALAIHISELVKLIRTGRPLELHVTNVVASLDDDPPMQMYLETATSLACATSLATRQLTSLYARALHRRGLCYMSFLTSPA
jgi:hypothetical protein